MNNVTVLYFMTTGWNCPACHSLKPHVMQACSDFGIGMSIVDIGKDGEALGVQYNICSLPTVVVLHDGEEVGRIDNGVTKQGVIDLIRAAKND